MAHAIAALRSFNRFYTGHVGALDASFLSSELTLPEARVLYEVASRSPAIASEIGSELAMDPGYLSRVLRRFAARGYIERGRGDDARRRPIALTAAGRAVFDTLDARQYARVAAIVAPLAPVDAAALVGALDTVRTMLGAPGGEIRIRDFLPGDMGGVVSRQADYYAREHDWSGGMEQLLLEVCAGFLRDHVPGRSNCWIAERGGAMVGSVFVVDAGDGVAQLRLLHVEPAARGLGLGGALVGRCVDLARAAGYREIMLWTHSVLVPARRLYEAAGFRIASTEMHDEFGVPVEGETWRLSLADDR